MRYSDAELLQSLRNVADEAGKVPTQKMANSRADLACHRTYRKRFGSWNKAIEAAGLTPRPHRTDGESAKEWYIRQKREGECIDCHEDDPRVLEFHHVGEKSANVGELVSQQYSLRRVKEEADKCVLICANCHRKRHRDGPRDGWR